MFSMTTTASSMIRPMAIAKPPSDIKLSEPPKSFRKKKVPTTERGSEVAAISVVRPSRRNTKRISTASRPPSKIASRTFAIALWTNSARSYTTERRRVDGIAEPRLAALCLRSEEHTSELQSLAYLVCRLLLEKKKKTYIQ